MNATVAGGSQRVTVPQTTASPSAERSTSRPSSNATAPPLPCTLCSSMGHHRPIPAVNTSNATAGSASTRISLRIGGTVLTGGSSARARTVRSGGG